MADVRDRIKALEQLTPQDFGIGVLFDSLSDAIVVGDAGSERIVLWNPAAQDIFGYTADEIVGAPIHTLIPERLRDEHRRGLAGFAATGEGAFINAPISADLPALRNDGSEIEIALSLTPVVTPKVDGRFAMAVIRDITHRRRLEEQLRDNEESLRTAVEELKRQERMRTDFVAMMVHDLRAPTAVVGGFADILRRHWKEFDEDRVADFLDRIHGSVDQLIHLIDDLLTVAELEGGRFAYELRPLDLAGLLYSVISDHRAAGSERRYEVRVPEGLPLGFGDERRQRQILNNLVSNASKFSPPGSTVRSTIELQEAALVVRITDQGPGIPEDDRQRVFERFTRLDATQKVKGTGLGLFITKQLVEGQGGEIWVEGHHGSGASFVYTVPVAADRRKSSST